MFFAINFPLLVDFSVAYGFVSGCIRAVGFITVVRAISGSVTTSFILNATTVAEEFVISAVISCKRRGMLSNLWISHVGSFLSIGVTHRRKRKVQEAPTLA
jgi:hypothetical protein